MHILSVIFGACFCSLQAVAETGVRIGLLRGCLECVVKTRLSVLQEWLVMHGAALGRLLHIGVSGVCLLAVLGAVVLTEKAMVHVIKENLGQKPHTQ